jgi:integrase
VARQHIIDTPDPGWPCGQNQTLTIVEEVRGQHPTYVFTYLDRRGQRHPLKRLTCSGWRSARRRAAARYDEELSRPLPTGFRRLRVHDLRHTFDRRLRAVGVGLEDRQDLLGHKSGRMTTHYSAAEIGKPAGSRQSLGRLTRI